MHFRHLAFAFLLAPHCLRAQRVEMAWAFGASVATQPVVRSGGNVGRLSRALVAEVATHFVDDRTRRLGMVVQAVPSPGMRVTGRDLEGREITRFYSPTPNLVLRVLADAAPWRTDGLFTPSFGFGYTSYVYP